MENEILPAGGGPTSLGRTSLTAPSSAGLVRSARGGLQAAIRARLSIVFAGPPGSGKTTLLTCCAAELDPSLRVVIAEEVFETDVPLPKVRGGCMQ